ncbi:MAG: hypothetical protein PHD09_04825 [Candidatus Omnitrophica bacterium]|nr:hypothetical protein [Candidatus Omnitrophota bacterium]
MKKDLFRADVARSGNVKIDRDSAVINGFAVVTKGVTKDSRGEFDDISLDSVVELGNKLKTGVKSRFGHPNMSSTALGTFLGRVRNFRRDGDIVRADLHIDKTAFETPDGDLAGYVLNLAESDPEMFGASMVIYWDEEKREGLDANGNELPPFIRVTNLFSVDVVDDPAANNGLFGMPFFSESVRPSAEMTAFLDKFLNNPDAVEKTIGFLNRYRLSKETENKSKKEVAAMDELTVEKLKDERKDVFEAIHKQGFDAGVQDERGRTVAILKKAESFQGMSALALESVEQGLSLDQSVVKFQQKRLDDIEKASAPVVGPDGEEVSKKKVTHLERARQYQKEHGCGMTDALKATADKR